MGAGMAADKDPEPLPQPGLPQSLRFSHCKEEAVGVIPFLSRRRWDSEVSHPCPCWKCEPRVAGTLRPELSVPPRCSLRPPRSGFLAAKTEGLTWGHKALSTPVRDTEMTRHPQAFQVSPVSPTPAPLNPLGWGGVGDGGPRESVTLHPLGQKMGPDRHSISSRPHFLFRSLNRTWP